MTARRERSVDPPRAEVGIDRDAYRHNVERLRSLVGSSVEVWPVVKADAYGHDAEHLAQEAIAVGARRLCVATLSEARHLRQVGIRVPMLVLGPLDEPGIRRAAELDVAVTVLSERMAEAIERGAAGGRPVRVHVKVDTGMGRWGVPLDRATIVLERMHACPHAVVEGVMTHLATADDRDDDGFFGIQLDRFDEVVAHARALVPSIVAHAANSAGALRSPRARYDAVRVGVATYGLDPMQRDPADHGLSPVLSLRSHVADVRELRPGESTGYCRTHVAVDRELVALVPLGYADGLNRLLGNRGHVLIGGTERAIVGNISMDHVSVLVDETVRAGDVVTVIGRDGDARVLTEQHAAWAGTINYEITCGIATEPRLQRTLLATGRA